MGAAGATVRAQLASITMSVQAHARGRTTELGVWRGDGRRRRYSGCGGRGKGRRRSGAEVLRPVAAVLHERALARPHVARPLARVAALTDAPLDLHGGVNGS